MSEDSNKKWQKIKEEHGAETEVNENVFDEDSDEEGDAGAHEAALEHPDYRQLEEQLTAAEQKAHENWEKAARAIAELENVRRRAERDVANAHRYGSEKLLNSLLPVADSLEQALQLSEKEQNNSMHEGLELTMKMLLDVFKKHEVEQIDPQGQPFNPQEHEAMSMQETADASPNTVLAVFQKGYKLHDRIIRPARVVVAKAKSNS
ncbi:nucleotide exchange factor GrpE [Legionella jordanis]|uniref:Protein GrpE n=1 Tax=Legionella jordanis TaxID=456 RepID=A0A0W0VAW3_9GAMM|nr:nucleotide exchange factor GrpE [Legionella jordanis]KTD16761.1 heat shock protein GrpE [Legionella jordanis]RMX03711.1 nucleotide exchange factor GrpE [Legionella jordanis]RMX22227.1 nucleotide exchange factor GrpE [Legionella jordanis]VEH11771.1 heat shock protein GrpE [Legionella jordanis]